MLTRKVAILAADPVTLPAAHLSWMAGISVVVEMIGLDPLALVWGALGGFVLQSYRKEREGTVFVMSKVASASFVAAAFTPGIVIWLVANEYFDASNFKSNSIGIAFFVGGAAQGAILAVADGVPALIRYHFDRWKRGRNG